MKNSATGAVITGFTVQRWNTKNATAFYKLTGVTGFKDGYFLELSEFADRLKKIVGFGSRELIKTTGLAVIRQFLKENTIVVVEVSGGVYELESTPGAWKIDPKWNSEITEVERAAANRKRVGSSVKVEVEKVPLAERIESLRFAARFQEEFGRKMAKPKEVEEKMEKVVKLRVPKVKRIPRPPRWEETLKRRTQQFKILDQLIPTLNLDKVGWRQTAGKVLGVTTSTLSNILREYRPELMGSGQGPRGVRGSLNEIRQRQLEWINQIEQILPQLDLTQRGWRSLLAKQLNIVPSHVTGLLRRYRPDVYGNLILKKNKSSE